MSCTRKHVFTHLSHNIQLVMHMNMRPIQIIVSAYSNDEWKFICV